MHQFCGKQSWRASCHGRIRRFATLVSHTINGKLHSIHALISSSHNPKSVAFIYYVFCKRLHTKHNKHKIQLKVLFLIFQMSYEASNNLLQFQHWTQETQNCTVTFKFSQNFTYVFIRKKVYDYGDQTSL